MEKTHIDQIVHDAAKERLTDYLTKASADDLIRIALREKEVPESAKCEGIDPQSIAYHLLSRGCQQIIDKILKGDQLVLKGKKLTVNNREIISI